MSSYSENRLNSGVIGNNQSLDQNKFKASIETDLYQPQNRNQQLLLPSLSGAQFKTMTQSTTETNHQFEQTDTFFENNSELNSNISDQGFYLKDIEYLMGQIKEKEDQLIYQERKRMEEQKRINEEYETLRQYIRKKEGELISYKQKCTNLKKHLEKQNNMLEIKKIEIAELQEKVKQISSDLFSEKFKCHEFQQQIVKIEQYYKKEDQKQQLNNSEMLKQMEIENKNRRQEIDLSQSSLCNSIVLEQGRIINTNQSTQSNENDAELYQIAFQAKDEQIEKLYHEINESKQKTLELEEANEDNKKQYEQQLRQWKNEAQKLIEAFREVAIKLQLQQQVEAQQNSYSNSKFEPKILNYLAELQTYSNSSFNFKIEPKTLNILADWYQKIQLQYIDEKKQLLNEKEKYEQRILELQKEQENDQQYKQQLTQWEVEGEKLLDILRDSGTFIGSPSNVKINPIQLHNLAEFCQKVFSENNKKIEELTLQIQKNENRIKELETANEIEKKEHELQLMNWENQTQRLKEKILCIDNELTDKQEDILQNQLIIKDLQSQNLELESKLSKVSKIVQKFKQQIITYDLIIQSK